MTKSPRNNIKSKRNTILIYNVKTTMYSTSTRRKVKAKNDHN